MKCWIAWISPISRGCAVDHGQEDHAERFLHRGVLEELVEHDLRFGAALQFDHDAHAVAVAFVADVADAVDASCSLTRSAMRSISRALFTWYGISVTMMASRSLRQCARWRPWRASGSGRVRLV